MTGTDSTTAEHPRFGVNYVPGQGWWYCWVDWNADAVQRDLEAIAALGCDHIRIHCLWSVFQPNPTLVSASALDRLAELLDLAASVHLDVVITVLDGWLSGFDFRPPWLKNSNIFADPDAVRAETLLITAIAERARNHPNFLGIDVANEPDVLANDARNQSTSAEADSWVETMLALCESVAPGGTHSVGMAHPPWVTADSPFGRDTLANTGALTPIHAWTYFTGALARYGATGTGTLHLAEYMLELAKAHQRDPQRQVWLQEYGVAPTWMNEADACDYVVAATRAAYSVEGLWGITWWCSHDISRDLGGFAELEYDLGLLTVDNVVKPTGERFRDLIDTLRSIPSPQPKREAALILPEGVTPDLDFADAFFALCDQGIRPAIVLEGRQDAAGYLAERGITRLVRPEHA